MSNQFHQRLKAIHTAIAAIPEAAVDAAAKKIAATQVPIPVTVTHCTPMGGGNPGTPTPEVALLAEKVEARLAEIDTFRRDVTQRLDQTNARLVCLCALCEVSEVLWRWESEKGPELSAELMAVFNKYRATVAAVAEYHLDDWGKLCGKLPKALTTEEQAHRGHLLKKIARSVSGISD